MKSFEIRKKFFDFFESKGHKIVSSAPMVIKNDPSLMFTNAGMNQFKDFFLGNDKSDFSRIANTQKCLRVSGKHNDLEEVGIDTYHHTFFEMLGNWSFGDYFKKEAIKWAWELLTEVYKIDSSLLYVTIFQGDNKDNLDQDQESYSYWKQIIPENKILLGSKKDNFWEMGDQGPCGPCTEIHIDLRSSKEKALVSGSELVNKDHPEVIELWNIVFIEFNRLADSSLQKLKQKHVDTGMGFERLCMVLQNKKSNYDSDIFILLIKQIETKTNKKYGNHEKVDIAIRVISDHVRTIFFAISDGQLPNNNGPGYVIRRILRRAVRYYYTFLDIKEPFLFSLINSVSQELGETFPELLKQESFAKRVIKEEEIAFLKTLNQGLTLLDQLIASSKTKIIDGFKVFQLYDTFGFPKDLTSLILREKGYSIDNLGFENAMKTQKLRSRSASNIDLSDWEEISDDKNSIFVGYDNLRIECKIIKFRKVKSAKDGEFYQIVLDKTPFYPQGGGQVGDVGELIFENGNKIIIDNTVKENNLIIHITKNIPIKSSSHVIAQVDSEFRLNISRNHTATHLLQQALITILGSHIEQKGSMINSKNFRFDFSHFSKLSKIQIDEVENFVNTKINEKLILEEKRNVPIKEALDKGAKAFFGEKYGDLVRTIKFGKSIELCGGIHVKNTSDLWHFKIISESSVASGIRRIEAITGYHVLKIFENKINLVDKISEELKYPENLMKSIKLLIQENSNLKNQIDTLNQSNLKSISEKLIDKKDKINGFYSIIDRVDLSPKLIKDLILGIGKGENDLFILITSVYKTKPYINCYISKDLVAKKSISASQIIKKISYLIDGGGGGQDFYASAGGKKTENLNKILIEVKKMIVNFK